MIKFMNLVKNEYIKIFRRVSTWILIILVALAAIGFNSMLKIGQVYSERSSDSYYSDPKNAIQDMKNEINYLKQEKADGYEIDIERCNFMIDHKISYRMTGVMMIFPLCLKEKIFVFGEVCGRNYGSIFR